MAKVNINFKVDKEDKQEFEKNLDEMGLNLTTAFNMFIKKVNQEKGIPFKLTAKPESMVVDYDSKKVLEISQRVFDDYSEAFEELAR
ncbi:MAG: type II toxin-antitoxin system RelB/DinJ family antitoxin [Clostridiaceae bacterium]|mgnify:CR=1 FL=1|nr:type II toxin-antitoxin system RelB/DinJ family antitoxin [Clostridiaceae bacterium]